MPETPLPASQADTVVAPRSCGDLFLSFTVLALQGFGGVAAVAQRELVERKRWMTNTQFVEEWAVAQIMPGPNLVNLSLMLGARHFGVRGALSALAGMLSMPLLVLLSLAWLYTHHAGQPAVAGPCAAWARWRPAWWSAPA